MDGCIPWLYNNLGESWKWKCSKTWGETIMAFVIMVSNHGSISHEVRSEEFPSNARVNLLLFVVSHCKEVAIHYLANTTYQVSKRSKQPTIQFRSMRNFL